MNKQVRIPKINDAPLRRLADAGYQIIPLRSPTATRVGKDGKVAKVGKAPSDRDWTTIPYKNDAVISRCFSKQINAGVRLSDDDLILDVDPRHDGLASLDKLRADFRTLDLDAFPLVVTGRDGFHYYGKKPPGLKVNTTLKAYPGLDWKTRGSQVVAPGSIHPDTLKPYRLEDFPNPPPQDAPQWPSEVLEAVKRQPRKSTGAEGGVHSSDELAAMLKRLDVTKFRDHDEWLHLAMACHHATDGEGVEEFIAWSTSDPGYADFDEDIRGRWITFHNDTSGGITAATLYKALKDAGAGDAIPKVAAKDDFDEDVDPIWLKDKEPSFDNQSVPKLNNVDPNNVGNLFRKVNLNGKMRVAYWGKSQLDKKARILQLWSFAEFRNALIAKHVVIATKAVDKKGNETKRESRLPLADWFLTNPENYMFDGVTLQVEQSSDTPDAINLWRGFSIEPSEDGSWDLLRAHIRDNIAKKEKNHDSYIIRWIAWAVQNPDKPCEVALILKSKTHGTGKGVLLRAIRKLFGAHGMQISKTGLLTGRFNAHLAMTCFLFVDEMTIGDNKETATLNSTLTEDALAVEPKGIDAYMIPNHVKVAAASNQEHVVYVADTDRRFAVFDVGDDHANDHPYFNAMNEQLDAGGLARMLHDLQHMDLKGWHPRVGIPDTDDRNEEKVESAAPELQWLAGYLDSGDLDAQVDRRGGSVVYASDFYDRARKLPGLRHWSDNKFASFLKKWGVTRDRGGGRSKWAFPPLADMRARWHKERPWWPPFDKDVSEWSDAYPIEDDESGFG